MRVIKPTALEFVRAKMAKKCDYVLLGNLEQCLRKHNLIHKPHLICYIDEKGVTVEHIVTGADYQAQAVTSEKGKTQKQLLLLELEVQIDLLFLYILFFHGKRLNSDLLKGASHWSSATVSGNGGSNMEVFHKYLTEHFVQF